MIIEHAQDAECGSQALIAAVNPQTGRQVVNLQPGMIITPLITLQAVGGRWIDSDGHEWIRRADAWSHAATCVCTWARPRT